MRSQCRRGLITTACSLSIALCLSIPAGPARHSLGRGTEDGTRQPQKGDKPQTEAPKYDRIEPKYEGGKYVGDKFYRGGKLVKETTTGYHGTSDDVESETVTEYDPGSGGKYKTREEKTTYRRDKSKRSYTVTEYGGVNNIQKRRKKIFLEDGGTFEEDTTYEPGGSAVDEENRIKTRDVIVTDKYRRAQQIEHYEWSESVPKKITSGYRQEFEYPDDKDATQPSKKKEEHYEVGKDGKGEWKPGLLPPPKSASKPASKPTPAPPKTPNPTAPPKKALKGETAKIILGVVLPANSLPGEKATVSVVPDPERYESIPGLKVVRQEIEVPAGTMAASVLAGIVVDAGDGRAQRADEPVALDMPNTLATLTLRWRDDQTPLARFDLPIGQTIPVSDEGLDLSDSPELKPGEEKVRKAREEAYRRALRRATESKQGVEEARRAKVTEEELAKQKRPASLRRRRRESVRGRARWRKRPERRRPARPLKPPAPRLTGCRRLRRTAASRSSPGRSTAPPSRTT